MKKDIEIIIGDIRDFDSVWRAIKGVDTVFHLAALNGAEVPVKGPDELSIDSATGTQVVLHAMEWMNKHAHSYDLIMLLQPTSPLRTLENIDTAVEHLFSKGAKSVVSVCKTDNHPFWSNSLPNNMNMNHFIRPEILNRNRQDLPVYYRINGAIYLADWKYFFDNKSFFGKDTYAYTMPVDKSVDIDTEIDLKLAEALLGGNKLMTD